MLNKPQNRAQWELQVMICQLQVNQAHTRARYYEQRMVSGAYTKRLGFALRGGSDGEPLNQQELVESELVTMNSHIQRAEELTDRMCALLAIEAEYPPKT